MGNHLSTCTCSFLLATVLVCGSISDAAADSEIDFQFSGQIGVESQSYWQHGAYPGQRRQSFGVTLEPELYFETESGSSFTFKPFYRHDTMDPRRRRGDIREAYFLWYGQAGEGEWELRLGIDQIFWGVAESTNIVNIINQSDLVEDPFDKKKLGQPMAHLTWSADWGITEFFVLPYHRKRTFSGLKGRFRSPLVVDNNEPVYENSDKERHVDYAIRYSHSLGPVDFGVSGFAGTNRKPSFCPFPTVENPNPSPCASSPTALIPYYEQIHQVGLDLQVTLESSLVKLEAIRRKGARNSNFVEEDYSAYTIGGEYTFYSVFDSDSDVTLLSEWNHDSRGSRSTEDLEHDVFLGLRWALNDTQDTQFVLGYVGDTRYDTSVLTAEFSRRISDRISLEADIFNVENADSRDVAFHTIRKDSFIQVRLNYNF